ncbi:hypothetical protein G6F65_018103 [Rhizopus arrhizus]|nr:hypothetical protein G6F65_018103 [Rhizopus arrhizus]
MIRRPHWLFLHHPSALARSVRCLASLSPVPAAGIQSCVFGYDLVLALAQQQANGRAVLWVFDLLIHGRQVEAQLAQMLGLELAALQFDNHIAAQLEVVEQQVDKKFVAAHIQQHLPSDKGEASAQLQ